MRKKSHCKRIFIVTILLFGVIAVYATEKKLQEKNGITGEVVCDSLSSVIKDEFGGMIAVTERIEEFGGKKVRGFVVFSTNFSYPCLKSYLNALLPVLKYYHINLKFPFIDFLIISNSLGKKGWNVKIAGPVAHAIALEKEGNKYLNVLIRDNTKFFKITNNGNDLVIPKKRWNTLSDRSSIKCNQNISKTENADYATEDRGRDRLDDTTLTLKQRVRGSGIEDLVGDLMPSNVESPKIKEKKVLRRSKASINRVVMRNLAAIRYKYKKRLREKAGLAGQIEVKFVINELGNVTHTSIVRSTINDTKFEKSLLKFIQKWNFGKLNGVKETIITYPFEFSR